MKLLTHKKHTHKKATKAIYEGRDHLVVSDVVLAVEGVMNGAFVPASVLDKSVNSWNGRPVPINHPQVAGEYTTANSPQIAERYNVGFLFNAKMQDRPLPSGAMGIKNALVADVWVDIKKAETLQGEAVQVLANMQNGVPFDVSTGYWGDSEEKRGDWYGVPYSKVMLTIYPDHLALLPNQTGACTLPVCGVYANKKDGIMQINVLDEARQPRFEGTEETSWEDVPKTFTHFRDMFYEKTEATAPDEEIAQVSEAPDDMREWIAGHTLLGDPLADNERDLIFFPVVNPDTGRLNRGALSAVLGGRAAQADIPNEAKKSAQTIARELLETHYSEENKNMENKKDVLEEAVKEPATPETNANKTPCGCGGKSTSLSINEDVVNSLLTFKSEVDALGGLDGIQAIKAELMAHKNAELDRKRQAIASAKGIDVSLLQGASAEKVEEAYNALPPTFVNYSVAGVGDYAYQVNNSTEEVWE